MRKSYEKVESRFLSVICEPAPSDLGQLVMSADGLINIMDKYDIEPIPNTLSTLANGEMFRRLVLDDIVDPEVWQNFGPPQFHTSLSSTHQFHPLHSTPKNPQFHTKTPRN